MIGKPRVQIKSPGRGWNLKSKVQIKEFKEIKGTDQLSSYNGYATWWTSAQMEDLGPPSWGSWKAWGLQHKTKVQIKEFNKIQGTDHQVAADLYLEFHWIP